MNQRQVQHTKNSTRSFMVLVKLSGISYNYWRLYSHLGLYILYVFSDILDPFGSLLFFNKPPFQPYLGFAICIQTIWWHPYKRGYFFKTIIRFFKYQISIFLCPRPLPCFIALFSCNLLPPKWNHEDDSIRGEEGRYCLVPSSTLSFKFSRL